MISFVCRFIARELGVDGSSRTGKRNVRIKSCFGTWNCSTVISELEVHSPMLIERISDPFRPKTPFLFVVSCPWKEISKAYRKGRPRWWRAWRKEPCKILIDSHRSLLRLWTYSWLDTYFLWKLVVVFQGEVPFANLVVQCCCDNLLDAFMIFPEKMSMWFQDFDRELELVVAVTRARLKDRRYTCSS